MEKTKISEPLKINVRRACSEDLSGILGMLYQLSPPGPGEISQYPPREKILGEILRNPDYYLCIASMDNEIIATGTLLVQINLSHSGKPYGHVENVVTDTRFRGKGIGLEVVKSLLSEARKRNCYKVILNCELHNIPFYMKCGFHETGKVEMRVNP